MRPGIRRIPRKMQVLSAGGLLALRPHDHLCGVRLAHVARAALVLDDVRRADHGWPGAVGDGLRDCRAELALTPQPSARADFTESLSRPRQPAARVHDAVDLLRVLAVPRSSGRRTSPKRRSGTSIARAMAGSSLRWFSWSSISPFHSWCSLSRAVKRHASMLAKVAAGLLVMRFFDLFWLSAPAFAHDGAFHSIGSMSRCRFRWRPSGLVSSCINSAAVRCCRCMTRNSARR